MDDLLSQSSKHGHFKYLEDLLKALLRSGFKISPKTCQPFWTEFQFMGNTIFIKDKKNLCQSNKYQTGNHTEIKPPKIANEGN